MNDTRCKHGLIRDWCAVCNPPQGYKPNRYSSSCRGVGRVFEDPRPMYDRPITRERRTHGTV